MNNGNYKKTEYNMPFIVQRADPYVCRERGTYYFTASVPEYDRIILRQSKNLEGLKDAGEITIWRKHDRGIMSCHIWAPELHYIDGQWFVYFAAGGADDVWKIRPYVLKCEGDDPMRDTWTELGQMQGIEGFSFQDFSLDMTVFEWRGAMYCVWAEKVNVGKKISNLYIAEMESPNKLRTAQVLLSSPDYEWEREGFWVNEGPAVLFHDDRIYLTYSASETGICYCVGMLSIRTDQDLLDPRQWKKERYPVLCTDWNKGILGPGHNSFVKNESGEDIMFYHARQYDEIEGDPLYDPNRHTYRMKVKWEKGVPVFDFANNF